jgi:serine protease Do
MISNRSKCPDLKRVDIQSGRSELMDKHCVRLSARTLVVLCVLTSSPVLAQTRAPAAPAATLVALDGSIETLVQTVDPAVVQIFVSGTVAADRPDRADLVATQRGSGSGVVVDPDGYVVTNAHVVRGASRIRIAIPIALDGKSVLARRSRTVGAQLVGLDDETDLAVLKVEGSGYRALQFADSDDLRSGQVVLAFGSPLGLQNSVSLGIVSAVARQLEPDSPMVYVQTDASISPGNSGGPLVDTNGRLVGINTMIAAPSEGGSGLGFAAPSNIVRTVFEQIRRNGRVRRGEIGIRAQTVTPVLAAGLGLARDQGALIADVIPGGPADSAGLIAGDLVVTLDGKAMENGRQLQVNLYRRTVGETVRLEVLRSGKTVTLTVPVGERLDPVSGAASAVDPRQNVIARLGILGVTVTPDLAARLRGLRAPAGVLVAVANAVAVDAEGLRLEAGDVIHAVNGRWVSDLDGLRTLVDALKPGDAVVLQVERRSGLLYLGLTID